MQTSVKLQETFSYSIFVIVAILFLILAFTIYILIKNKKKQRKINTVEIKEVSKDKKELIQQKYLNELEKLENKIKQNEITLRQVYQKLSNIIRHFVYEVTGIKVQNYTLEEIEKINMTMLHELIKEYYAPEFAKKSLGDAKSSVEKTRKVIEKWN